MDKSVLLVTPFFAPQSHAPVFRMHKLAKYLPDYGWKPHVLTVDINYIYNEDPSLLDELPSEVEVYRSRYIEPTIRGIRMALGGSDRTFSALKEKRQQAENHYEIHNFDDGNTGGLLSKTYRYLLNRYLKNPDAYWTWRKAALRKAKELIDQYNIPIVITTFPPHTCFEIGGQLKEETGIKWVADFRDPGSYQQRSGNELNNAIIKKRNIESHALCNADYKVVTSSVYPLLFQEMYGDKSNNFIHIPTGMDEDLPGKNPVKDPKNPWIVFVGEFLKEYGDNFFKILKVLTEETEIPPNFRVLVIGHIKINKQVIVPMIKRYDLKNCIEFYDHMPQADLYEILRKSAAAVLIPGRQTLFSCNFAKMADYIGLQIPVLADVPEISEARNELQKAGIGIFLDGTIDGNARKISAFLKDEIKIGSDQEYCKKYLASSQVKMFSKVLNQLVGDT